MTTPHARRAVTAGVVLLVLGGAVVVRAQGPTPGAPRPGAPAAAAPVSEQVKITMLTVPPAKRVLVFWGKKRLGLIAPKQPLIILRPRDSGPMDLIFQSEGYVTVQTRAFTFGDNKLTVKLTPVDQKNTLLGYRQELPPDVVPDAGVPVPPGGVPPGAVAPPNPGAVAPPNPGMVLPRDAGGH